MIYRLPLFAQVAVIRQMKPHECFFLGSLSKKSKRLVQRSTKKTLNATIICLVSKQIKICNNSNTNQEYEKGITYWSKCDKITTNKKKSREDKWITLEYNGVKMKCRLTFDDFYVNYYGPPTVSCNSKQIKFVPLALQKAISDVFDIPNVIQFKMGLSSKALTDFPSITQVDLINDSLVTEVNEKALDRFLKRVQVKHSIQFINWMRFNPKSPIFSIDHLLVDKAEELSRECFLNFAGKSAMFRDTEKLKSQDLIDFVKMWLNGTNTKLEAVVVVDHAINSFDREEVLKEFETMPWDPKRRDGRFKFPENSQTLEHSNDLLDCTQQVDIQRTHDGLLATIVVTEEEFCFFVWHTPFAPQGNNMPVTVLNDYDQSVSYLLGTISF
ncbi:unnamed protein product [Caenorhabditis brenneri]